MPTVSVVFVGHLTDEEHVSAAIYPLSKPALYVTHSGPGLMRLKVETSADASAAVIEELTAQVRGGVNVQFVPRAFAKPFNSVVVTIQAVGVCSDIAVHLCEAGVNESPYLFSTLVNASGDILTDGTDKLVSK